MHPRVPNPSIFTNYPERGCEAMISRDTLWSTNLTEMALRERGLVLSTAVSLASIIALAEQEAISICCLSKCVNHHGEVDFYTWPIHVLSNTVSTGQWGYLNLNPME